MAGDNPTTNGNPALANSTGYEGRTWWENDSLWFNWDFRATGFVGDRSESAVLYLHHNNHSTLVMDWLADSCSKVVISMWNFTTKSWKTVWDSSTIVYVYDAHGNPIPTSTWSTGTWTHSEFNATANFRNATDVAVRFQVWNHFPYASYEEAHWIPQVFVDYAGTRS
jgi:hypothetical protein